MAIAPAERLLLRPPTDADGPDVDDLLDAVVPHIPENWRAEVIRDVAEFREAVGVAALSRIRFDSLAEIVGVASDDGPPPLSPVGARDRHYHAALALIGRPGVVVFTALSEGMTEREARSRLDEARRFQLTISFFEVFAETPLAGFDPYAAVEDHFVPACFEDDRVLHTIAMVAGTGKERADPAVIDAALGAAAGERPSPRRRELAEELVAALRRGDELHDDPDTWRRLVDTEDVLRAIVAGQPPIDAEKEVAQMTAIASALGHGVEVLRRHHGRMRIQEPVKDLGGLVDSTLEVAAERESDPQVTAATLAHLATAMQFDDAIALVPLLLDRLERERLILVVPTVRTLAERLTNSGDPHQALALLDHVDEVLEWDSFDRHQAATRRANLLNERGNALRAMLDTRGAFTAYERALEMLQGSGHDDDTRVVRLNRARALRDEGYLPRAISEFRELLDGLGGRERFDVLFGLALALQRNGQWQEAQAVLDEAAELVRAEPLDDQLARFVQTLATNARALGREEAVPLLLDKVRNSPFTSARQQLLTLGISSVAALRSGDPGPQLTAMTLELARKFDLPARATSDPEFAITWADAVRLAGDRVLAREVLETALVSLRQPVVGMQAAGVAAEMAIDDGRWHDAGRHVEQVGAFLTDYASAATAGSTTVTLADTLSNVRALSARLITAPEGERLDRLLSMVADLGSSLQLSLQIAREHLPVSSEMRAPQDASVQILQWLEGGQTQLPLLVASDGGAPTVHRGKPLPTSLVDGLGERIANRLDRSLPLESSDVLEGVATFRAFRDAAAEALAQLPIDPAVPLTVVPSAPMAGIPMHAALPGYDVALSPSLAVALSLAHRATACVRQADTVGEVRCWGHDELEPFVPALIAGGEGLRALCAQHGAPYEVVSDTAATRAGVAELVDTSTWLKLSCHGVVNRDRGRFGLLLSDGEHAPPKMSDVLNRAEYGTRYLYDWNDVADTHSRCRAVVSTACMSGSTGVTLGGEQIGLARAFLRSGVLAFVAPLWPVVVGPAQLFANELLARCLAEPGLPLATQLTRTRGALREAVPPRVADAFVLHGYPGPVNPTA
ncbi:CHAT domain-containing tetratricopeptide repeat protein [Streptomyces sp. NBC_00457]|uniref:CHAT domain-containing protein n=1 Tax=Streptomyces sp. NBC_00457 TaxID=2975748 RepID=UPI002E1F095C